MQSRFRILVIDDDPMFRNVIVSLLRKDYIISVAPDGESGFEKAQLHRPDLVIIDYQMPGWDGLQTLKAFRNDLRFQSIKTVMLTSDASKETVMAAIQAGTDSYIIKTTFNKDDFLAKIHEHLSPQIARPVTVKSSASPQTGTRPFDPTQKPAIPATGTASSVTNFETKDPSGESASPSLPKRSPLTAGVENKATEESVSVPSEDEDFDLAKEMEEFKKTLSEKSSDELIEETVAVVPPEQGLHSEEDLLEDVMDEWE